METLAEKKVVWLINKHAAPIKYNATNMRTYKLAYYFTQMGYNAYIISSSFVHNRNIDLINSNKHIEEKEYDGVKFIHIKTCPYSSNKLKRVYSIYQFSKRLLQYKNALTNVIKNTSINVIKKYKKSVTKRLRHKH